MFTRFNAEQGSESRVSVQVICLPRLNCFEVGMTSLLIGWSGPGAMAWCETQLSQRPRRYFTAQELVSRVPIEGLHSWRKSKRAGNFQMAIYLKYDQRVLSWPNPSSGSRSIIVGHDQRCNALACGASLLRHRQSSHPGANFHLVGCSD